MSKGGIVWLKTINHNAIENNFVQVIKCQCKSLVLLKTEFLTKVFHKLLTKLLSRLHLINVQYWNYLNVSLSFKFSRI